MGLDSNIRTVDCHFITECEDPDTGTFTLNLTESDNGTLSQYLLGCCLVVIQSGLNLVLFGEQCVCSY